MTIENHVTSLQLSKRLWELGVRKPRIFHWFVDEASGYTFLVGPYSLVDSEKKYQERYPAYLASEVAEMLPLEIVNQGLPSLALNISRMNYFLGNNAWRAYYTFPIDNRILAKQEKLQNVLADLLIQLIENGYVKAEDL